MTATKSTKGRVRGEARKLADLVQREIDGGATTVEEIHKSIANLPLDILERLDVFEAMVKDVRKVQETSIGAVYDVIRRINQEVGDYAKELLAARPEGKPSRRASRKPSHAPAHKPVHAPAHGG